MPSPAVGIIVSLSIITALGLAVIENPQIQAWLEEQRQRIAELLRSIGQELDPESRRAAEAFAFEGRTPVNDAGLRRELSGSQDAAAVATGRSMSNVGASRRIPVKGPSDPDEAEERRRRGREYLARRNQEMYELQQRRKDKAKEGGTATPPSPTSFDAMVDGEGKLRLVDNELPDPPTSVPVPEQLQAEMAEVERHLAQPMLVDESSSSASAWQAGSRMANPFDDENGMDIDRSETPKPPVPPKIALEELPPQPVADEEHEERPQTSRMPGSFTPISGSTSTRMRGAQAAAESGRPDMTYEEQEQLAIALSLSEAERRASEDAERRRSQAEEEDAELRAAILASLREQQASSAQQPAPPAPLIDITETHAAPQAQRPSTRGHWEALFNQEYSPAHEPLSAVPRSVTSEEEDELYSVTPQLTRARLASLDALGLTANLPPAPTTYDPIREATASHQQPALDESFYSAASPITRSQTLEREPPQLIDTTVPTASSPPTLYPATPSTHTADAASTASSDTFASISTRSPPPRTQISAAPSTRHEDSDVEVLDITDQGDSDVDMLSEVGGEGIRTPDSWTEVGSRDGESEDEDAGGRERATWADV